MDRKAFAVYAQIVLLAASGALAERRFMQTDTFDSDIDNDESCLLLDLERVGAMDEVFPNGNWVNDGEVLKDQWKSGTGIYAINYCVGDDEFFGSVQIIVGTEEEQVKLRKHGKAGGVCRQWILKEGDYIRTVQWTWDFNTFNHEGVTQLVFQSQEGETRVIGREQGRKVSYEYTAWQPFIGLYTFEIDGDTKAVGAWEDDCHGQPKRLPFGLGTTNETTSAEVFGNKTGPSMTWDNESSGESALDNQLLDQALANEKIHDSIIPEPEDKESVFDIEFIENEPNMTIITPPKAKEAILEESSVPLPPPEIEFEEAPAQAEIFRETIVLQSQLEKVKKELVSKTDLLTERETEERVSENTKAEKEEDSDLAWTLFAIMTVLVIFMSCIILVMCCYIRSQKRQRLNANDVQRRGNAPRVEESSDIEAIDTRKAPTAYLGMPRTSLNATPSAADTSNQMMLGGQAPLGNYTYQQDKENKADDVAEPEGVQLDFAADQPEVNQAPGRNPFESNVDLGVNDLDDDVGADLNLTEESAAGPGAVQDNFAVGANPETRQ